MPSHLRAGWAGWVLLLAIGLVLAMAPLGMSDALAIAGGRLLDGFDDLGAWTADASRWRQSIRRAGR